MGEEFLILELSNVNKNKNSRTHQPIKSWTSLPWSSLVCISDILPSLPWRPAVFTPRHPWSLPPCHTASLSHPPPSTLTTASAGLPSRRGGKVSAWKNNLHSYFYRISEIAANDRREVFFPATKFVTFCIILFVLPLWLRIHLQACNRFEKCFRL